MSTGTSSYSIPILLGLAGLMSGCMTSPHIDNPAGRPAAYESPSDKGAVSGTGIESQDIVAMTDTMVRDMLSNPMLANRNVAPYIIIDATEFKNRSSTRIDKDAITNRLRVFLNRAANGRMLFVGRQNISRVEKERALKRSGTVSDATLPRSSATAGADFALTGAITSQDARNKSNGMVSRYHQITFELIDLERGFIVWSNIYEFKKSAQDHVVYR